MRGCAVLVLGAWVAAGGSACSSSLIGPGGARDGAAAGDAAADAGARPDGDWRDAPAAPDAAGDAAPGGDVAPAADAAPIGCTDDGDCTGGQGCYRGVCRARCTLGSCLLAPGGGYCRDGFCVPCLQDSHCGGTRFECDPATWSCVERPVDCSLTRIGMFYNTWHCYVSADNPHGAAVHDISEVLAGNQSWGPAGAAHWWDEPAAGYYCLARNDALLTQHATLLRDAGVDFVFVDATNHAYVDSRSDRTPEMILAPMERLLAVWSTVPNAPRVVPWVPVPAATANPAIYTVDALLEMLGRYPGMHFPYLGKPLLLVTDNAQYVPNETRLTALAATCTVRRMWGLLSADGPMWSFLQGCDQEPTAPEPCAQRGAILGGAIEQIPIGTAYQATYMNLPTATPKHRGLTFRRQFETLLYNPDTPIATITGWNEWLSQRQPCDATPGCPCSSSPSGCFIDQYDVERSRDIEPAKNAMGDYYYRLVRDCISLFRSGQLCGPATAANLCCREADV
jgi:hypothetical protein